MVVEFTGKRIASIKLYKERKRNGILPFAHHHVPFILVYLVLAWICFNTVGDQYHEALTVAEEEGWVLPNSMETHVS